MPYNRSIVCVICSTLSVLGVLGCGSENGENDALVTIQGQVDTGVAALPIAPAICQFVQRNGRLVDKNTTDANGVFQLQVPPERQGFIGCYPPALPNLQLTTFVSTEGAIAGGILPEQGIEEVSLRTTVVASIIAQTVPAHPQSRKRELLQALGRPDADLATLVDAATALYTAMLETQVSDVSFGTGEGSDDVDGGGSDGGVGDDGGVAGDAGDGGEFSPLRAVLCEFTRDLQGDSALEDLFTDGTLDLQHLQSLTVEVAESTALSTAFTRFFPNGIQPLRAGQPLRVRTDPRDGSYLLRVAPADPGFVRCIPRAKLAIATVVRGRPRGSVLREQDVSPASHLFAALLLPRLAPQEAPQDVQAIYKNFLDDIGNLREPSNRVLHVETVPTDTGRLIMADADGDDIACDLRGDTEIDYPAAGGAVLVASTLFKGLLLEAGPAAANFTQLLEVLFTRTTDTGDPLLEAIGEHLVLGGIRAERAAEMATTWNTCVRSRIEQDLHSSLAAVVRAGRLRVAVRTGDGLPVPNAQVTVAGAFIASDSACPTPIESSEGRLVCQTNRKGRVTFILQSASNLTRTPVQVTVRSADGALLSRKQTDFLSPTTRDLVLLVGSD